MKNVLQELETKHGYTVRPVTILDLIAEARTIHLAEIQKAEEERRRDLREEEEREVKTFTERLLPHVRKALGEVRAEERDTWTRPITLRFTAGDIAITARCGDRCFTLRQPNGAQAIFDAADSPGEFTQNFLLALGNIVAPMMQTPDDIPF